MFFLLRVAFWIGLVLVLLPSDNAPDAKKTPQVDAAEAVSAATAAVSDLTQFCTRQPHACEIGGQAATVIGHRAQSGARKVYDFLRDTKPAENGKKNGEKSGDETGSIGAMQAPELAPDNTLQPEDLAPDWRGTLSPDEIVVEGRG